jgi:hypothetical protein
MQRACNVTKVARDRAESLVARGDQPLIGVLIEENEQDATRYFAEEDAADLVVPDSTTQRALDMIGAWSDLDWDEMVEALDRIRHESVPTPPIDDL